MTSPRRALVVIDVQQQYFSGPLEVQHPPHAESLPRITAALDAANEAGVPVAAFQHTTAAGAPVFDPTTPQWQLHPEVEQRLRPGSFRSEKQFGTVFAGTGLVDWLRERDVDTLTLVGYMTNNCVLASAAEAETHGLSVEVLRRHRRHQHHQRGRLRRRPERAHHAARPAELQLGRRRRHRPVGPGGRCRDPVVRVQPGGLSGAGRGPHSRLTAPNAPQRACATAEVPTPSSRRGSSTELGDAPTRSRRQRW